MRVSILNILLLTAGLKALTAAPVNGQELSKVSVKLEVKDQSIRTVLQKIETQTGYKFVYSEQIGNLHVSLPKKSYKLKSALDDMTAQHKNLTYETYSSNDTHYVVIREVVRNADDTKPEQQSTKEIAKPLNAAMFTVSGTVTEASTQIGMAGVNVVVKGTTRGTSTDADGKYSIDAEADETLVFSFIGFRSIETLVGQRTQIDMIMETDATALNEVEVRSTGYWTETKERSTSSTVKITAKEIQDQPVTSPLMALQGRVPGLDITPGVGVAGSGVKVEIRGRNSVRWDGGYPLYVIDGIPVDSKPVQSNNGEILNGGGFDPLSTINPANIESIEILKDADATAIYGSRGANGVILITTKKGGNSGKTHVEISTYAGGGKVTNFLDMLSTEQYLEMRHEAFKNAGATPQPWDGFDLLQWDTTRYTNWQKELFGKTAGIYNIQANISGGNKNTSFRLGGSHHKEGMVFPGDFGFKRTTGHFNLNHASSDYKFRAALTTNFGVESNKIFTGLSPVAAALSLPPNAPKVYNDDGTLNWENSTWNNPYSGLEQTDQSHGTNLVVNTNLSYELIPGLQIKSNLGYTQLNRNGVNKIPFSSMNPAWIGPASTAYSYFESSARSSWIIEPQLNYTREFSGHRVDVLVGSTWQQATSSHQLVRADGYTSDVLLGSLRGATTTTFFDDSNSDYRYMAFFGRIGYSLHDKYILNLTGRRDGSSRFGPNNRYATFGAVGAAWIFTRENFLKDNAVLSFGKIRASYGTSGNDQIGDYRYLSTYGYTSGSYGSTVGLAPRGLYNADYAWELTKKIEVALEVGFLKDRISFAASWYRNRSSNQLLDYPLPSTTGFTSVLTNLNALVENTGMELSLQTVNLSKGNFRWMTSFNATFPRNKLIEFNGIEESAYHTLFTVGQSLNIVKTYNSKGVNPQTGLYEVEDINGDGIMDNIDRVFTVDLGREYYGGVSNTLSYKGIELSFLFQFSKQLKAHSVPLGGQPTNQPVEVWNNRWRTEGDVAKFQKFTTGYDIFTPQNNYIGSNGPYVDGSFVRLKTLSLSYQFPSKLLAPLKCSMLRVYVQGQNLFTLTPLTILLDPETNNNLPPLRVLTGGIDIKF